MSVLVCGLGMVQSDHPLLKRASDLRQVLRPSQTASDLHPCCDAVVICAAHLVRSVNHANAGQPKVRELHMPIRRDKHVIRLHIPETCKQ